MSDLEKIQEWLENKSTITELDDEKTTLYIYPNKISDCVTLGVMLAGFFGDIDNVDVSPKFRITSIGTFTNNFYLQIDYP